MFLIMFVFCDSFIIPLNGKIGAHRERCHLFTTDPFLDVWIVDYKTWVTFSVDLFYVSGKNLLAAIHK